MSDKIKISVDKHHSLADEIMAAATFTKNEGTYRVTASDGEHKVRAESSDKDAAIQAATSRLNDLRNK